MPTIKIKELRLKQDLLNALKTLVNGGTIISVCDGIKCTNCAFFAKKSAGFCKLHLFQFKSKESNQHTITLLTKHIRGIDFRSVDRASILIDRIFDQSQD